MSEGHYRVTVHDWKGRIIFTVALAERQSLDWLTPFGADAARLHIVYVPPEDDDGR